MKPDDVLFDDTPSDSVPPSPAAKEAHLIELARRLPATVHLGTSSWNFPGWRGIVYSRGSGTLGLASSGLSAYAQYPIFRTVGLDRNFYRPLDATAFAAFSQQVSDDFRFLVKAPRETTDPYLRSDNGRPRGENPCFLNAALAQKNFLAPVQAGLGDKAGPLVFQFSPFPHAVLRSNTARVDLVVRIAKYFRELQAFNLSGRLLAAEFRNYELLTPRMLGELREIGVRPVLGLHPAMPGVRRQIEALYFYETGRRLHRAGDKENLSNAEQPVLTKNVLGNTAELAEKKALETAPVVEASEGYDPNWRFSGPVVIRWSLAAHRFYDTAKRDWSPFDAIHAADPVTRALLAGVIVRAVRSSVESYMVANNKAEGCAPKTMKAIAELVVRLLRPETAVTSL